HGAGAGQGRRGPGRDAGRTDNYKTAEEIASKRLFFDGHSKKDFKEVVMAPVQVFDKSGIYEKSSINHRPLS
ncbi:hypothetical protein, partial [Aquabacterium sp.]|uniref:hypothetical protein n=1 Tax=Aquabacterium sp. TaxID=1872578 RepID=UPI0035C6D011